MKIANNIILATISIGAIVVIMHEYGIHGGGLAILALLLLLSLTSLFQVSIMTLTNKNIAFSLSSYKTFILPGISTLICLFLIYINNMTDNIGTIASISFVIASIYTVALKIMNMRKR
jgi:hypothetical protein